MVRQRLRLRTSPLDWAGRLVLVLVSLGLVWYGLMVLLLAFKVAPDTVNTISGYRDAYDSLADLESEDVTNTVRLVTGLGGLAAFLLFGYLAWKEIPRPYLPRGDVGLRSDERGEVTIEPRAIERAAELAALEHPRISEATGLHGGDDLTINVTVKRARELPETLRDVQSRVVAALSRHGLPAVPVHITLTGCERKRRRELE